MNKLMHEEIMNIVSSFKQLPYLFVGTGLSMRYSDAPSWSDLIYLLWHKVNTGEKEDFDLFVMQISHELGILYDPDNEEQKYELNPELAQRISDQFFEKFFSDPSFTQSVITPEDKKLIIENRYDPFKYYISKLIKDISIKKDDPSELELPYLKNNSNKIAGIITTNYDQLLDDIFPEFNVLIGQSDLLIANTNNIFEIFKIHGSCNDPNSLVITSKDYMKFIEKLKYLSAKLLTIFVEHPIVFIGYGLGDRNIRYILQEICNCLTPDQMRCIQNNFIFIKPAFGGKEEIKTQELIFDRNHISMMEITLEDYSDFYTSLSEIKSSLPVKLVRKLQDMVCNFVYSTEITNNIIFGNLNSPDIDDGKTAIFVGPMDTINELGFSSFTIMDIIEDIIFDNKAYLMQRKLIDETFPNIRARSGAIYLPPYKYLNGLGLSLDDLPEQLNIIRSYGDIPLTTTDISNTKKSPAFSSIQEIEIAFPDHIPKQFSHIFKSKENLSSNEICIYLRKLYNCKHLNKQINLTNFKKLGVLYDYKKYCLKE